MWRDLPNLTSCSGYTSSFDSCISSVTTATSANLCNGECPDRTAITLPSNSTSYSCSYTPVPFSWDPQQPAITIQEWTLPIYMIHQRSDIPRTGLSTTAKIAIGVVVPVVVLLAIILEGLYFMRKLKKGKRSKRSTTPSSGEGVEESKKGDRSASKRPAARGRDWHWV